MSEDSPSSYDALPYTSYSYDRTHPAHLYTVGALFGASPAPVTACRVLELGCGSGGNLLPMAALLPGSTFVGLDRSVVQIQDAQELAQRAGVSNVSFHHLDLRDVDDAWGTFDYIICHGVYSWVPEAVQAKILEIMRDRLAPHGLGYVSYNTYPGWHMRDMIRHMMRYHVRNIESPEHAANQARALVDFLGRYVPQKSTYGMMLHQELNILRSTKPDYIYHEHLEDMNAPVYFHQFAERLDAHRLRYVGETDLHSMLVSGYAPEVAETLHRIAPDIVSMEQYMDFIRNRQFRASVICHRDIELNRNLRPEQLDRYAFEFTGKDPGPVDLSPGVAHEFVTAEDIRLETHRPITKAAFLVLRNKHPRALSLAALHDAATQMIEEAGIARQPDDRELLGADLLSASFCAAIRIRSWQAPMTTSPGLQPYVPAAARVLAERFGFVPSLTHKTIHLTKPQAFVVPLFDGEHSQAELIQRLIDLVGKGELQLTKDGQVLHDPEAIRQPVTQVFGQMMAHLTANAVFMRPEDDPSRAANDDPS